MERGLDISTVEHGDLRGASGTATARSAPDGAGPANPGYAYTEAVLLSSPSNRTRFAALATGLLPDLHAVDPANRVIPRQK